MEKKWIIMAILTISMMLFFVAGCGAKTKKYKVDYQGQQSLFKGAKSSYEEGEPVVLKYDAIATDTSYSFFVDGKQVSAELSDNVFLISFIMPAHDIEVYCSTKNTTTRQIKVEAIKEFHYSYLNPMALTGYDFSAVVQDDGTVKISYRTDEAPEIDELYMTGDESILSTLGAIAAECGVKEWDGFKESDDEASDGDGFFLKIVYSDGTMVSASGNNAFPDGFLYFNQLLGQFVEPYAKSMLEEAGKTSSNE